MRAIAKILFIITTLAAVGGLAEAVGVRGFGGIVLAVLLTIPLAIVVVAVHELGHAWAVRRLGGKVESLTVLGIDFVGTWQPSSSRPSSGNEIGGHVAYTFDGGETRHEAALIAAAGPAANILLALAAGLAAVLLASWASFDAAPALITTIDFQPTGGPAMRLPSDADVQELLRAHRQQRTWSGSGNFLGALAVLSAGIGLANLVPFKGSDGAAIFDALRPAWRR